MTYFYGEIASIDKDKFRATNKDGGEIISPIDNIPKSIIPDLGIGTSIKLDYITGDLFYQKGKSRNWIFTKSVFLTKSKTE